MADVPANEQLWMCEDCGAEYKRAPVIDIGPHASLMCSCGATNTIREFVRMPGLRCPQCFHVSIDQGGGIACEGRAMDRLHFSRPKELVWLIARVEEAREKPAVGKGRRVEL